MYDDTVSLPTAPGSTWCRACTDRRGWRRNWGRSRAPAGLGSSDGDLHVVPIGIRKTAVTMTRAALAGAIICTDGACCELPGSVRLQHQGEPRAARTTQPGRRAVLIDEPLARLATVWTENGKCHHLQVSSHPQTPLSRVPQQSLTRLTCEADGYCLARGVTRESIEAGRPEGRRWLPRCQARVTAAV